VDCRGGFKIPLPGGGLPCYAWRNRSGTDAVRDPCAISVVTLGPPGRLL